VSGGPSLGSGLALFSAAKLLAGLVQARRIAREFSPQVMLTTGGWPTIAPTLACWGRCPILVAMPDTEPGSAIRFLSRVAARIAVTSEASTRFFSPGKTVITGYPVRADLLRAAGYSALGEPLADIPEAKLQARAKFSLAPDLPTLLVFGGSKGARSINRALSAHLDALLRQCQIVHISGPLDWDETQRRAAQLSAEAGGRYHPYDYLHGEDMALALGAADLVVSRSGASTLGEFPLFGLPAILVPYPHAWRYQKTNADVLASRGGAIRLDDERLAEELGDRITELLNQPDERARMSAAMKSLAHPDAAAHIAQTLIGLVSRSVSQPVR
jgi:UDP-N-acetylglucosamine--N-acetylmuramyl-(pentapeptide) pyrophosphoryl-undecaprenol N-acetylglucosamine transferase